MRTQEQVNEPKERSSIDSLVCSGIIGTIVAYIILRQAYETGIHRPWIKLRGKTPLRIIDDPDTFCSYYVAKEDHHYVPEYPCDDTYLG